MPGFEAQNPNFARDLERLVLNMPIVKFLGLRFLSVKPGDVSRRVPATARRGARELADCCVELERQMNRAEAEKHAEEWIRDWCARDIERIVSHYAEDARFVSPVAARRTGNPLVVGREALLKYWSFARGYGSFRFTLERVQWDDAKQEMVVVYTRDIDGHHDRACEIFRFDDHSQVIAGEAMYGAEGI